MLQNDVGGSNPPRPRIWGSCTIFADMATVFNRKQELVTLIYREVTYFSKVVSAGEYEEIKKTNEADADSFILIHSKMKTHQSCGPMGYVAFRGDVSDYLPDMVREVENRGEFKGRLCECLFVEPDQQLIAILDKEFQEYSKLFYKEEISVEITPGLY